MFVQLSLVDLFQKQFGISPDFVLDNVQQSVDNPKNTLTETELRSSKGLPLYDIDQFGRSYFMPVYIGPDKDNLSPLPYPVISISTRKSIVETSLTERNGTVKEIINVNDFRIRIRGFIIDPGNDWPESQIQQMHDLFSLQQPLVLQSALTDIFLLTDFRGGNDKVVITAIEWPENRGDKRVKPYEMELISDMDFNLEEI